MKENFWYVRLSGSYSSGLWCPFESREKAIEAVKKEAGDKEITFEGVNKWEDYEIKVNTTFFNRFTIHQRKKGEILKEEYAE